MRHLDRVERLGQRTDLVHLDQDRVAAAHFDAFFQELDIRYEQVVADQLAAIADLLGQHFPAFPVVFAHTVLDRVDRILRDQPLEVSHLLGRGALGTLGALELRIVVNAVFVELGRGAVHSDGHIAALALAARLVAGLLDRLDDRFERILGSVQRRSESALVTDGRAQSAVVQHLLQRVEHLGAHTETLLERRSADGTDHKFLKSDRSVGMRTAVDNIHHRDGQRLGVRTADIAVQRHAEQIGGSPRARQRNAQNSVGSQIALRRRAVQSDHRLVDADLIGYLHADNFLRNDIVDVLHGLQHALSAVTALVAVTQLERFVLAGGRSRGNGRATECAACSRYFHFDRRIAPRVEDLPAMNTDNLSHDSSF